MVEKSDAPVEQVIPALPLSTESLALDVQDLRQAARNLFTKASEEGTLVSMLSEVRAERALPLQPTQQSSLEL